MLFIAAFFLMIGTALAQTKVNGTVVSQEDNEPVIGASVLVVGTNTGTVTDANGRFSLDVPAGKTTLRITYVGMEPIEVSARPNMRIMLTSDQKALDEVIVVAYGTAKRSAFTGSAATMKADDISKRQVSSALNALTGSVSGVQVTAYNGQPGTDPTIRIRGVGSMSANSKPLYIVDGVPYDGNITDINPADIESMNVLKDASASAIYGSRGANGVIMITTVKGAMGTPAKVSYNGYISFKTLFKRYPMMDGPTFAKMRKYAGQYTNSLEESDDTNTDWQDMFYKTGVSHNHDITVSGGTQGGSYSFGAGYYHDEAVVPSQGYDRVSVRGNFDQMVGKWFRFGLTTNNSYRISKGSNVGLYNVLSMSPLASPYDADGNLKRTVHMPNDETWVLTKDVVEDNKDNWLNENKGIGSYNTVFAEVKCPWVEGLSYRLNLGLNYRSSKTGAYTGVGVNNTNPDYRNSGSVMENSTRNWAVENVITFDRTFAEKHHVNVVGMYSAEETTFEQTGAAVTEIPAAYFQYYNLGSALGEKNLNNYNYWQSGLMSWMGRVMYSYDNKYMISAAIRADASSRLAKGHQWHTYPAVSAGWNIARESFMENLKWIDNLKLRIGYGETSNQSISPYSTLGALATRDYNFNTTHTTGYYVSSLPNPELGWEYSKTWNFGLDFSLFNGRLYGTFEYYTQKTDNILLDVSMPSTSGVGSFTGNIGKTENKGFEFTLNGVIIENKNGWNWEAGINLYANRNKLTELASGQKEDVANRWFVGYPIDVIYDYKNIGIWQEGDPYLDVLEPGGNVGMIKVEYTGEYDADGKPVRQINADDRQVMDMEPDLMGGFNTTVSYKHFDLNVIGAFQIGGKLISAIHSSNGYLNMLTGRRGNLDVDYWTETNTGAKYPKPGGITSNDNPKYGSTLGYFNAGYLKIRAITLGYNFEHMKFVKDLGISRLRLYATIQNPFVLFSPYNNECGLDPETNTLANNSSTTATTLEGYTGKHMMPIIGYNTPSTRNFLFGINVTF